MDGSKAKTAVVSGVASGIGLATANRLVADGWRLSMADLDAGAIEKAIDFDLGNHLAISTDISDPDSVDALFTRAAEAFGGINAVANVAAVTYVEDARLEDVSLETFDQVQRVNVRGTFMMCKRAIPELRAMGSGAIVNVGSLASILGTGGASYVTSKHGVAGISRHIAYWYAEENIRCTTVCPGPTTTPMLERSKEKGPLPELRGTIGREITPDEIAASIAFLMSDEAAMITGTMQVVDGGMSQH